MPRVAQRDRRGASDEVVCVLAGAFGFESADDYGRANEATLPRLRAQARRARALAKVNAFVSRHGLAFSPPISPPISPLAISEHQVQVDYGRAKEATLPRLRAQARLFAREVGDGREMGAGAALAKVNAWVAGSQCCR